MSSFYGDKVALGLAEELSQVNCQDELEFADLFEYGFSAGQQGLFLSNLRKRRADGYNVGVTLPVAFG